MHERVPGSEFTLFENSAHMPFYEERDSCMQVMSEFLTRAEAAAD